MADKAASINRTYTGLNTKPVAAARRKSSPGGGYMIFLLPGLMMFLLVIILPFIVNIGISFTKWDGGSRFAPVWIGLANYQKAMGDSTFWASFSNNLILIIAITIIRTIIGLLLSSLLFDYIAM